MINLLYCGNNKAIDGIYVSLMSIIKNTKSEINTYVYTMDLHDIKDEYKPISHNQILYLDSLVKKVNPQSSIRLYDITKLFLTQMGSSVNIDSVYTPYCLLRLFADMVDGMPDKILYLDTDIMANKDIEELFDIDINDYEYAGAKDFLGRFFINYRYINSGVLLLNMKEIKKTGLFEKARKSCLYEKLAFPDQSALNVYAKRKKIISSKYNSQKFFNKKTIIRHFCKSIRLFPYIHTINIKPWNVKMLHKKLKIHEFDDVLDEYVKIKDNLKEM